MPDAEIVNVDGINLQGVLDEQFLQLQQLQDETSPNFVYEVTSIYFGESEKLLKNLRLLLYVNPSLIIIIIEP